MMLDLELLSDKAQAYFDEYVVSGTDDELFASGYLRGHVDLVLGGAIVSGQPLTLDETISQITKSINTAIKNGELSQQDVEVVNQILNKLLKHISK